ncbi:rho GTPase-activating protein 12-like [Lampetra fluviatilis]
MVEKMMERETAAAAARAETGKHRGGAGAETSTTVKAIYDYEYTNANGRRIVMVEGDVYHLVQKRNDEWWQVRKPGEPSPFYVPVVYVVELTADCDSPTAQGDARGVKEDPATCDDRHVDAKEGQRVMSLEGLGHEQESSSGSISEAGRLSCDGSSPGSPMMEYEQSVRSRNRSLRCSSSGNSVSDARECFGNYSSTRRKSTVSDTSSSKTSLKTRLLSATEDSEVFDLSSPTNGEGSTKDLVERADFLDNDDDGGGGDDQSVCSAPTSKSPHVSLNDDGDGAAESPLYANLGGSRGEDLREAPGRPPLGEEALRAVDGWEEHWDDGVARVFFFNPASGETSWKPPRRAASTSTGDLLTVECKDEQLYSEITYSDAAVPHGWQEIMGTDGNVLYVNAETQEQWTRFVDTATGSVYFYNEITNQSSWDLPKGGFASEPDEVTYECLRDFARHTLAPPITLGHELPTVERSKSFSSANRDSLIKPLGAEHKDKGHRRSRSGNFNVSDYLTPVTNKTIKQGTLNKAKIVEGGKKLRKSWSNVFVTLTTSTISFKESGPGWKLASMSTKGLHAVCLRGARIEAVRDKSSKKNVMQMTTVSEDVYLLQSDKEENVNQWLQEIHKVTQNLLPNSSNDDSDSKLTAHDEVTSLPKIQPTITRSSNRESRFLHLGRRVSTIDNKNKLKNLISRRPTRKDLEEKGIIKEQVFGCPLQTLCEREGSTVPNFARLSVQCVERKGLQVDGIYRVSGNLATIQKLRFIVDHEEKLDLEESQWDDVHVITGALKMFFRELPEPLFPFKFFPHFINAIKIKDYAEKIRCMGKLIAILPPTNRETMKLLFKHLATVVAHGKTNRMSVQNLAIVFGPTLLRPEQEVGHFAVHMMYQNQIVEHILTEHKTFFPE